MIDMFNPFSSNAQQLAGLPFTAAQSHKNALLEQLFFRLSLFRCLCQLNWTSLFPEEERLNDEMKDKTGFTEDAQDIIDWNYECTHYSTYRGRIWSPPCWFTKESKQKQIVLAKINSMMCYSDSKTDHTGLYWDDSMLGSGVDQWNRSMQHA